MRTYGTIDYNPEKSKWLISAEPHVMLRLKALFGKANKLQFGTVELHDTPETCRDLEWFIDRFPLHVLQPERLQSGSRTYQRTLAELEELQRPDYKPRDFDLAKPLREYQARAVETYLLRKGLLLADQLGLGKTVTAIGSFADPRTLPALVVCQTHLTTQWRNFVAEFMPGARTHVIQSMITYPLPTSDVYIVSYNKLARWVERFKGLVKSLVFDEIQELRRSESGKSCAAAFLRRHVDYCLGLSATPIYNLGGEIFNIVNVTNPGELGGRDEFYREWCSYRGKDKWALQEPDAFGTYLRDNYLMLRRTRRDVGRELPPVQRFVQPVVGDGDALLAIQDRAAELAQRILHGTFQESGLAAREFDMKLRQATGIAKAPEVAEFVKMLVEQGEQVLLGGWHREVYALWQMHLKEIPYVMYTGSETPAQKEAAKLAFLSGDAKVMMMSLRSGVGVDGLQEVCNLCVYGELDWSPGVHEQFAGRLHRDGQQDSVTAFYMVSDHGSDPLVANVLGLKEAQRDGLLDPGGSGLKRLQNDVDARVKQMAQDYLSRRGLVPGDAEVAA